MSKTLLDINLHEKESRSIFERISTFEETFRRHRAEYLAAAERGLEPFRGESYADYEARVGAENVPECFALPWTSRIEWGGDVYAPRPWPRTSHWHARGIVDEGRMLFGWSAASVEETFEMGFDDRACADAVAARRRSPWAARFALYLHLLGWTFRPWLWRKRTCRGELYRHEGRLVRASCACGRVFGEASDAEAQDLIHRVEGDRLGADRVY